VKIDGSVLKNLVAIPEPGIFNTGTEQVNFRSGSLFDKPSEDSSGDYSLWHL